MRVGIDAHSAERDGSGNCTYIRNLIDELTKLDQTNEYVLFVTNRDHPFYKTVVNRPNVHIVPLRSSSAWLRVFYLLPLAAHRKKVDLLHAQYFTPYGCKRLMNTIHDAAWMRFPEYFSRYERLLFRFLIPISAKRAKVIFSSSATARNDLIEFLHLPPEKVRVTYNGVPPIFSSGSFEKRWIYDICEGLGLNRDFVLYIGRIDPRKNLVRLIEAYSFFRSKYSTDHQLAIVGKVHLQPAALQKALEKCEYRDDIRFCGYVPDKDLPALYRAADVFTYVSEYEGFGLPPLEAMASGTPVVASDIPIFREILDDAAFLVNPFDVAAIAEAIYKLITDQTSRTKFIEKGRTRAKDFTWQKTAQVTLQAYQDAMKQS